MTTDRSYACIGLVSGKGGVGKTTIAANLAWLISSAPSRVLLIDLDLQNLGCTGLFASRYELGTNNASELLRAETPYSEMPVPPSITRVNEHLAFLPAAMMVDTLEERDVFLGAPHNISAKLAALLDALAGWYSFECFVLDCHGGIDALSIAAAGICDTTLVVTETDSVTFAGTLGLVDRYYDHYAEADIKPRIEYVVNRIPSKYKWKDLDRLYGYYIEKHLGRFTSSRTATSFIPAEDYLADSFGEYPFQVQLAPKALFAKKLQLLLYRLFQRSHPNLLSKQITSRFRKSRNAQRVQRNVMSLETRNLRTVVTAYALSSMVFLGLLPLVAIDVIMESELFTGTGFVIAAVVFIPYYVLAAFRVLQYFRQKFLFQRALWRVLPIDLQTVWRRMVLWKLRILYYGSAVMPTVIVLYAVGVVVVVSGLLLA